MNLLQETLGLLTENGHTTEDVFWVGSADGEFAISWEQFSYIADVEYYNDDYGAEQIASDLVIVGEDWWMSRGEFYGSGWDYYRKPARKDIYDKFTTVNKRSLGTTISRMNDEAI